MQAKISADNDCRRFPQVTFGKLPEPTGNFFEASFVRFRADMLEPMDAFFYPILNTLTEGTLDAFQINGKPFKFDYVPKKLDCSLLALQPVIKKRLLAEKIFTIAKKFEKWLLSLLTHFTILKGKNNVKRK